MCLIGKKVIITNNESFNSACRRKVVGKNAGSTSDLNISCFFY